MSSIDSEQLVNAMLEAYPCRRIRHQAGRGTLIFSYIRRLGTFIFFFLGGGGGGGQSFDFQYFGGFQKNE